MRFRTDEIVRVRMFDEIPDHWSKHMESLLGKIVEVFGTNDDGTVVAGQLRSSRFIWVESDLEKFPLQQGCTACIHRYRMDEGHFSEQKLDLDVIRGSRFRVMDVRPEFGLPIALSIENRTVWVKEEDIDFSTILSEDSRVQLDPNQCFAAKKRSERLGNRIYGIDKKMMSFREMYGGETKKAVPSLEGTITGRLKSSKPKPRLKVKATSADMTLKWSAPEAGEWKKSTLFIDEAQFSRVEPDHGNLRGDWENFKNPPPMEVKGIEPSEVMPNDFSLLEDDEFAPEPEELKLPIKEKKDPYAPYDDDIPF